MRNVLLMLIDGNTDNLLPSHGAESLSLQNYDSGDFAIQKVSFAPNAQKQKIDLMVREQLVDLMLDDWKHLLGQLSNARDRRIEYRKAFMKNYTIITKIFPDFPKVIVWIKEHRPAIYCNIKLAHMGSEGIHEALRICEQLGVTNFLSFLYIWGKAQFYVDPSLCYNKSHTNQDGKPPKRFSKKKFKECIQYFGKEEVQKFFVIDYYNMPKEGVSFADCNHPYADEKSNIMKYCTTTFLRDEELGIQDFFKPIYNGIVGEQVMTIDYLLSQTTMTVKDLLSFSDHTGHYSYIELLKLVADLQYDYCMVNKHAEDGVLSATGFKILSLDAIFSQEALCKYILNSMGMVDSDKFEVAKNAIQFLNKYSGQLTLPPIDETNLNAYAVAKQEEYRKEKILKDEQERIRAKESAIKHMPDARDGRNYHIIKSLKSVLSPAEISDSGAFSSNALTDVLGNNVARDVGFARQYYDVVKRLSQEYKGLFSVGGKIHFPTSIPQEKIQEFMANHKFGSTSFKLIHANTSILLPPSQYPEELLFMIQCLHKHGLLDNDPQLQIGIPGRMPNALGGILASSLMLLSNYHTEYTKESFAPTIFGEESFSTTHDDTGRMMVAYDGGTYDDRFKWNTPGVVGRTDVLLLKDPHLIPKAQVIGSLLSQTEYDGRFADLGMEFIKEYCELLVKHNMENIVTSPWIYNGEGGSTSGALSAHIAAVNKVSEKQYVDRMVYHATKQTRGLMVFDVYKLLNKYKEKIKSRQQSF